MPQKYIFRKYGWCYTEAAAASMESERSWGFCSRRCQQSSLNREHLDKNGKITLALGEIKMEILPFTSNNCHTSSNNRDLGGDMCVAPRLRQTVDFYELMANSTFLHLKSEVDFKSLPSYIEFYHNLKFSFQVRVLSFFGAVRVWKGNKNLGWGSTLTLASIRERMTFLGKGWRRRMDKGSKGVLNDRVKEIRYELGYLISKLVLLAYTQ